MSGFGEFLVKGSERWGIKRRYIFGVAFYFWGKAVDFILDGI